MLCKASDRPSSSDAEWPRRVGGPTTPSTRPSSPSPEYSPPAVGLAGASFRAYAARSDSISDSSPSWFFRTTPLPGAVSRRDRGSDWCRIRRGRVATRTTANAHPISCCEHPPTGVGERGQPATGREPTRNRSVFQHVTCASALSPVRRSSLPSWPPPTVRACCNRHRAVGLRGSTLPPSPHPSQVVAA
jgi:hypothetical protein